VAATEASDRLGEVYERARSEQHLSELHRIRGANSQARWLAERALSAFTAVGDQRGCADALVGLAGVQVATGALDEARASIEQALELFASIGARFGVASATNALGDVLRKQGDLEAAAAAYLRSQDLLTSLGSADRLFPALNLGFVRIEQGRPADAEAPLIAAETIAVAAKRSAMLGAVHAAMLCCDTARKDRSAFSGHLRSAREALMQSGMVDADIASALEQAATQALQLGWSEPSKSAMALAEAQRAALKG
jgi:tetratricopeptide (TPR) repeat protein